MARNRPGLPDVNAATVSVTRVPQDAAQVPDIAGVRQEGGVNTGGRGFDLAKMISQGLKLQ